MLASYSDQLDSILGLKGSPFDARCRQAAGRTTQTLAADRDAFSVRFEKWLPLPRRDIGRFLQKSLNEDPDVVVLYHANAVELVCGVVTS